MAHFAQIDENNIVTQVLVVDNEREEGAELWLSQTLGLGGTWVKTSYNTIGGQHRTGGTPFRKNFAGIGYTYDKERDAFIPPKPHNSWLLDELTCHWKAPTPRPLDDKVYVWNESTLSWDEV
jgi:hypothetical protein